MNQCQGLYDFCISSLLSDNFKSVQSLQTQLANNLVPSMYHHIPIGHN